MEFRSYDSFEEMMEAETKAQKEAAKRTKDWQKGIKKCDHFISDSGYGFPIFGEVLDDYRSEDPAMQYYRLCDCYSVACPEGEKGDVHISTISALISEDIFDFYRKKNSNLLVKQWNVHPKRELSLPQTAISKRWLNKEPFAKTSTTVFTFSP